MPRKKKTQKRYFAALFGRAIKGLPHGEVATMLGVTKRTVFYWLEGKISPSFDAGCEALERLAKAE